MAQSSIRQSPIRESSICSLQSASSSHSRRLLAHGQVAEQRLVQRGGGIQQGVVDAQLRELRSQRVAVFLDERAILFRERFGDDGDLLAAFEILERRRLVVAEVHFRRIEHVEHDPVVAAGAQRRDGLEHRLRVFVEVGDEDEEAAPREELGQLLHRRRQSSGPGRLQPIEDVERRLHVLGRRRHVLHDVVVEGGEADAVPLAVHHVGEAGGEDPAVLELADAAAAERHRLRDVEQTGEVDVGVGLVLLDIEAIGAPEQLPVDAADVVAGGVAAVLGEVDRRAELRRAVHPVDEPLDDRARHHLEVADACEDDGVHEPRPADPALLDFVSHYLRGGLRPAAPPYTLARGDPEAPLRSRGSLAAARSHRPTAYRLPPTAYRLPPTAYRLPPTAYIPDRGIGTASSSLSTSASLVTPSDCAWKFVSTRCRSTGCASARTSSKLTW